jgi:hypothetical protein
MHRVALVILVALAACHTRSWVLETRPGPSRNEVHHDRPRALAPTVVLSSDGRFRFVAPLRCAADVLVDIETTETVTKEANIATFVVGVIVATAGAVALTAGLSEDEPAKAGATWLGVGGLVVGLPFTIGPWIGNGTTDVPKGVQTVRKGAAEAPCGERAVTARTASVRAGAFQVFGSVDTGGTFELSPFVFVDAFAVGEQAALDITADLVDEGGITSISAVIDATALAGARDAWLAAAGIDDRVEPVRKVPRLEPGAAQVTRTSLDGRPRLRVVVPIHNAGPGPAWQVRGVVGADHPEVDGRIVYLGAIASGADATAELLIPLSAAADKELGAGEVELTVQLRDAHGTAPETPVRFRGRVREAR